MASWSHGEMTTISGDCKWEFISEKHLLCNMRFWFWNLFMCVIEWFDSVINQTFFIILICTSGSMSSFNIFAVDNMNRYRSTIALSVIFVLFQNHHCGQKPIILFFAFIPSIILFSLSSHLSYFILPTTALFVWYWGLHTDGSQLFVGLMKPKIFAVFVANVVISICFPA